MSKLFVANQKFSFDRASKHMAIALLLSLFLHLILISKYGLPSPLKKNRVGILHIKLNLPERPQPAKLADHQMTPTPVAENAKPVMRPAPKTKFPVQKASDPVPEIPKLVEISPDVQIEKSIEITDAGPANLEALQPPSVALEGQIIPPRWVEIEFNIYSGRDRKLLSKGLHYFESDDRGEYQVSFKQFVQPGASVIESTTPDIEAPVGSNQVDMWQLQIFGHIYRQGPGPAIFNQQGNLARQFITLASDPDKPSTLPIANSGRFPDAILDQQTLLYHFMFVAPKHTGNLLLTDGTRITSFSYHIAESSDADFLEIPNLGKIHTVHLILTAEKNTDTIELWLAPSLNYLPLKVQHSNLSGLVIEQLATAFKIKSSITGNSSITE